MKQDSVNNSNSTNNVRKQRSQYRQNDWDTTSESETVLVVDGWDISAHQKIKRDIRYTPRLEK